MIFVHIPKTAGTSMATILRSIYPGPDGLFVYDLSPTHLRAIRGEAHRCKLLCGHFPVGIDEILGIKGRYATFVRDPIARVVSFFEHQARDPQSEFFPDIARGMTLLDLLRSEECHQLNNHMTRALGRYEPADQLHSPHVLDSAKLNLLNRFDAIGITEHMTASIRLFQEVYGWTSVPSIPHLNSKPGGPLVVDDETRAAIEHYNALDLDLYRWVVDECPRTPRIAHRNRSEI